MADFSFTSTWRRFFGFGAVRMRRVIAKLIELAAQNNDSMRDAFVFWRDVWRSTSTVSSDETVPNSDDLRLKIPELRSFGDASFLSKLDASNADDERLDLLFFILQTYLAQTILATVERFFELDADQQYELFGPTPFDWGAEARKFLELDEQTFKRLRLDEYTKTNDPFGELYVKFFPSNIRNRLGEFYTPPSLATYLRTRALPNVQTSTTPRFLDPTCGAGVFLTSTLRDLLDEGVPPERALDRIAGFDLSPLAVLSARANLLFAATSRSFDQRRACCLRSLMQKRRERDQRSAVLPVCLFDSIRNEIPTTSVDYFSSRSTVSKQTAQKFDVIIGNPPWIAWDKTSSEYRAQTRDVWQKYGLFALSNKDARYGGSKKELASLLVYVAIDRYLVDSGVAAFVLPRSLFQSGKSGEGFRQFGTQNEQPFCTLAVDDFSELKLFSGVFSKVATAVFQKGRETQYPFPIRIWRRRDDVGTAKSTETTTLNDSPFVTFDEGKATPLDTRVGAPLRFTSLETTQKENVLKKDDALDRTQDSLVARLFAREEGRRCQYVAKLGANAAGASGVFWLEDRQTLDEPIVSVRNLGDVGRRKVETIEARVESELLFPLLRWRDVDSYVVRSTSTLMTIPQDRQKRRGFDEETMRQLYPATLAYLQRFESILRERAAYKRYQNRAPFWSLYNIDCSTFSNIKVVWRRMDSTMRAAVVLFDETRRRPIVPQETLSMIDVPSVEEADYLVAVLNSTFVRKLIESTSVPGSKGFGAPSVLQSTPIPKFDPNDELCIKLSEIGNERRILASEKVARLA